MICAPVTLNRNRPDTAPDYPLYLAESNQPTIGFPAQICVRIRGMLLDVSLSAEVAQPPVTRRMASGHQEGE